jgi:hypothetical protein
VSSVRCHYGCGRKANTRDHVIPKSRGGRIAFVKACASCNRERGSRPYVLFAHRKGVPLEKILTTINRASRAYEEFWGEPIPIADESAITNFIALVQKEQGVHLRWMSPLGLVNWTTR